MACRSAAPGHLEVGVAREVGGRHLVVGVDHRGVVGLDGLQHLVGGGHHQIAAEHQVGAGHAGADGVDLVGRLGDAHVAGDRAALLREARHVDGAEALAFEVRRLAEHGRERHHAGAADARDQHGVGRVEAPAASARAGSPACWRCRCRRPDFLAFFTLAPCTVTKLGQKPLRQEKSLLQADWSMARLVPSSVSSGSDGDAVRLDAAVAAALAHGRIDEHALVGIGEQAALAAAALLGRAGLVVDQHGDARHLAQLLLQRSAARGGGRPARPAGWRRRDTCAARR